MVLGIPALAVCFDQVSVSQQWLPCEMLFTHPVLLGKLATGIEGTHPLNRTVRKGGRNSIDFIFDSTLNYRMRLGGLHAGIML